MSDYTLYQGDCLEVMPTLEKGSVACVFADLPYATKGRQVTANAWDVAIDLPQFWQAVARLTGTRGWTLCTADLPHAACLYASNVAAYRHDIVWQKKGRPSGFLHARHAPLRSHEYILAFAKRQGVYNPQMTAGTAYSRTCRRRGKNYLGLDTIKNYSMPPSRYPLSIFSCPRVEGKQVHPTQKPVALLEWLIATYTKPDDLVLDPVFGSGTTGVACANLGRRFIGIEKDATYFAAGKERIEKAYADAKVGPAQTALSFAV